MFLFPGLRRKPGPRGDISMERYVLRVTWTMGIIALGASALQLGANLLLAIG